MHNQSSLIEDEKSPGIAQAKNERRNRLPPDSQLLVEKAPYELDGVPSNVLEKSGVLLEGISADKMEAKF